MQESPGEVKSEYWIELNKQIDNFLFQSYTTYVYCPVLLSSVDVRTNL